MMCKCKVWLWQTFLPVWAKESLLAENRRLEEQNRKLTAELGALRAYTDGLEAGIRAQRRIIIHNGGVQR